jgi:hypothetical protein
MPQRNSIRQRLRLREFPPTCLSTPSNPTLPQNLLTYTCTCASGPTPNVSDYQQTLPALECDEWVKECVAGSMSLATNNFCLSHVCGNKTAAAGSAASSTPSSSAGAENTATATATGGAESTATHSAAMALRAGRDYGTGALALGLVSLFALLL